MPDDQVKGLAEIYGLGFVACNEWMKKELQK